MVYRQAGATEAELLTVDHKTEVNAALITELRGLEALAIFSSALLHAGYQNL
jgi:hypothetical protein